MKKTFEAAEPKTLTRSQFRLLPELELDSYDRTINIGTSEDPLYKRMFVCDEHTCPGPTSPELKSLDRKISQALKENGFESETSVMDLSHMATHKARLIFAKSSAVVYEYKQELDIVVGGPIAYIHTFTVTVISPEEYICNAMHATLESEVPNYAKR